jgi:hypothetical protein
MKNTAMLMCNGRDIMNTASLFMRKATEHMNNAAKFMCTAAVFINVASCELRHLHVFQARLLRKAGNYYSRPQEEAPQQSAGRNL